MRGGLMAAGYDVDCRMEMVWTEIKAILDHLDKLEGQIKIIEAILHRSYLAGAPVGTPRVPPNS